MRAAMLSNSIKQKGIIHIFADGALWTTATKILGLIDDSAGSSRLYTETVTGLSRSN
jgi:hypothetical protein